MKKKPVYPESSVRPDMSGGGESSQPFLMNSVSGGPGGQQQEDERNGSKKKADVTRNVSNATTISNLPSTEEVEQSSVDGGVPCGDPGGEPSEEHVVFIQDYEDDDRHPADADPPRLPSAAATDSEVHYHRANMDGTGEAPCANHTVTADATSGMSTQNVDDANRSQAPAKHRNSSTSDKYLGRLAYCWARRTRLEHSLIIVSLLLSISTLVLIITLGNTRAGQDRNTDSRMCLTEHCVEAASSILDRMDQSVSPCDDFYEFSCGNWLRKSIIPDTEHTYDVFYILTNKVRETLKFLLEAPTKPSEDEALVKAKNFYKSCINTTLIGQHGSAPLLSVLTPSGVGLWPLLHGEQWSSDEFDMETLLAKLMRYGKTTLIDVRAEADDMNSKKVIQVDQGFSILQRFQYLNESDPKKTQLVNAYMSYMLDVVHLLTTPGQTLNHTAIFEDVRQTIDFERQIVDMISNPTIPWRGREAETHSAMNISYLQEQVPQIDWLRFYKMLLHPYHEIEAHEEITVRSLTYLVNMGELIGRTDKRVLCNYLLWLFVEEMVDKLDERFVEVSSVFYEHVYADLKSRPRWRDCVTVTMNAMDLAVSSLYVREYVQKGSKQDVESMIENLKEAFIHLLEELDWADVETKRASKDKLHAIDQKIAYPDSILDSEMLMKYYGGLEMDPTMFFHNVLNARTFQVNKSLEGFKMPGWYFSPLVVNAYYYGVMNQIVFLTGILQRPFYDVEIPQYLNYGAIGVVIGHEITHGFDDTGRKYDKDGNLTQWWKDEDIKRFNDKAQCFVRQYSGYQIDGAGTINGNSTIGENIADNGGVKQSFYAYQKWVERNGAEPALPGLPYTPEQLFFISFAQVFCEKRTTTSLKDVVRADTHTPGRYRVIGSISNSPDFQEAFSCPLNSPMNPEKKCEVW